MGSVSDLGFIARATSALVALVSAAVLVLRIVVQLDQTSSLTEAVSELSQFFTILTIVLVLIFMLSVTAGYRVSPYLAQALTTAVIGAAFVYYIALAHLLDLSGLRLIADHGVHIVVPALTLLWWLLFAPKAPLSTLSVLTWIAWPFIYCVYIQVRAAWSGFYPYPFIDLPEIGLLGLLRNTVVLGLVFVALGLLLSAFASWFDRFKSKRE